MGFNVGATRIHKVLFLLSPKIREELSLSRSNNRLDSLR